MADLATTEEFAIGIPRNCGCWHDGTRYWLFYVNNTNKIYCRYGTDLTDINGWSSSFTNSAGTDNIDHVNNAGRAYAMIFGENSGTQYAWMLLNASDISTGEAYSLYRWTLTGSGLSSASTATPSIGDKAAGHTSLQPNYGSGDVTDIYGAVQGANNDSASTRTQTFALASDTGMGAVDSSVINFPEHTFVGELSDGYLAFVIDQGHTAEINGDFGHLREWTKTNVGDAWSSEATIEGSVSGASAGNGDFTDQNYATNTSHAGQQDYRQLDDGSIVVAYIDNADLTNADTGVIKLVTRGNAKASGWTLRSSDVIGSSAEAWHLCMTTDGTDAWIFYVKDATGRDGSIYYKKYTASTQTLGTEAKLADMNSGYTFNRMTGTWKCDTPLVAWTEEQDASPGNFLIRMAEVATTGVSQASTMLLAGVGI